MSGVNLQAIYDRLASAPKYHPLSANTFADWSMEAGDIVTVSRDGTDYSSPVGTMTMRWTGKQQIQIQSEGSRERDPISRVSARKYATGGGGTSGIRANQSLYYEMFSEDGQLHAVISATAESLTSDYSKKIEDTGIELRGVITQTAESLTSDYTKKFTEQNVELRGVIRQTAESLVSDYSMKIGDVDNALRGVITQTAESLTSDYSNKIAETESHISQTAGQIRLEVDDVKEGLESEIEIERGRIGLVVSGEGANAKIKPASIVASINNAGSSVAIDADHVNISGTTKINDVMTVVDGGLVVNRAALFRTGTNTVSINGGKVTAQVVQAGDLKFAGNGEGQYRELDYAKMGNVVVDASVSGNTLTLTKGDGTTLNFSKATTLSGTWSGSIYTVTANPQNVKKTIGFSSSASEYLTIYGKGGEYLHPTADGYIYKPVAVGTVNTGSAPTEHATADILVDATTVYSRGQSSGWDTARGKVSIPGSGSDGGITAKWPGSSYNTQTTRTYTLMEDGQNIVGLYYNSAAEGQPANYVKAAQLNHNEYTTGRNNGWDTARGKVSIPGSGSGGSITASWPNSSYNSQISRTYTLMEDGYNIVGLYYNSAAAGQPANYVKVAQLNHNEYTAGRNSVKLQEKSVTSNGDVYPDAGYDGMSKVTVDVPTGGGEISIPRGDIYTTDRTPSGTNASTLRNNYEQARSDGDYVVFHVTCGDASRWYYMEP